MNRRLQATFLLIGALALSSCDFGIDEDDFALRFRPKHIETVFVGALVDAQTGVPLLQEDIPVHLSGPDRDLLVNYYNEPLGDFESDGGIVSFALQDGFTPSAANPARFTVSVVLEGYLPASRSFEVSRGGRHMFELRLVDLDDLPAGISSGSGTGDLDPDGRLFNDLTLETGDGTGAGASLLLPAGVRLLDEAGGPLGSPITATVLYLSNQSPAALAAFPGGFSVTVQQGGAERDGVFVTGGLMMVTIEDVWGRAAALAEVDGNPILATIDVPAPTINPVSGQPVQPGASVPTWWLDEESGVWHALGDVPLGEIVDPGGYLPATMALGGAGKGSAQIIIPGALNVDWLWEDVGELVLTFGAGGPAGTLTGEVTAPGNIATFVIPPGPLPQDRFVVPQVACNLPGSAAVVRVPGTATAVTVASDNLCTSADVPLDAAEVCPNLLRFEAYGSCSDGDVEIRQANLAFVYANSATLTPVRAGAVVDGVVGLCVMPDTDYILSAFVEGEQYELSLSVGGSAEQFSISAFGIDVLVADEPNDDGLTQVEFVLPEDVCGDL